MSFNDDKERKSNKQQSTNKNSKKKKEKFSNDDKTNQLIGTNESQCYICLNTRVNPCYADNCLHQFCTSCLMEWSKNSDQCPVCRTTFENLIINVKSDSNYETIPIQPHPPRDQQQLALENLLDLIISEITRNIPEVSTNPQNTERSPSSHEASPSTSRSRIRPESTNIRKVTNNRARGNQNSRENDLTIGSEAENHCHWRRLSRERRRRRRPRLISNSTEKDDKKSSSSSISASTIQKINPSNQGSASPRADDDNPPTDNKPEQMEIKEDQNSNPDLAETNLNNKVSRRKAQPRKRN